MSGAFLRRIGRRVSAPSPAISAPNTELPSVYAILKDRCEAPWDLKSFRNFCEDVYAKENVNFLLHVMDFAKMRDPKAAREKGKAIYNLFIAAGSPEEVNITARNRKSIQDELELMRTEESLLRPRLFQQASDHVLQTLAMDVLPKYRAVVAPGVTKKRPSRIAAEIITSLSTLSEERDVSKARVKETSVNTLLSLATSSYNEVPVST